MEDGTTLTTADNSGATSEGAAPVNVGKYVAKITATKEDATGSPATATASFEITKIDITAVTFTEPTAPVANETPALTVAGLGENYTGTISWAPEATTFGYSTAYTATITLTADDNYKFKSDVTVPANWNKAATSTEALLVLTRTYTETGAAPHTHSFATAWSNDATYHWHACTGEGDSAECLNVTGAAKGAHEYGTEGAARYTCTTCAYVDTAKKAEADLYDAKTAAKAGTDAKVWLAIDPDDFFFTKRSICAYESKPIFAISLVTNTYDFCRNRIVLSNHNIHAKKIS